jgi:hypothetical protein
LVPAQVVNEGRGGISKEMRKLRKKRKEVLF